MPHYRYIIPGKWYVAYEFSRDVVGFAGEGSYEELYRGIDPLYRVSLFLKIKRDIEIDYW